MTTNFLEITGEFLQITSQKCLWNLTGYFSVI